MSCTLPVDVGACETLVGTLLHSPEAIDDVITIVRPEDFFDARSRAVYAAAVQLHNEGLPVTTPAIAVRLGNRLEEIGGAAGLIELMSRGDAAHNARFHAEIVRTDADRVRLLQELEIIARKAKDRSQNFSEVLAESRAKIDAVEDGRGSADEPVSAAVGISEVASDLVSGEKESVVESGFLKLDELLSGGFRSGELIIVAARPSVGKSAWAGNVAAYAGKHGTATLFVSLEQSRKELLQRLAASESRIDHGRIRRRELRGEIEEHAVSLACDEIARWPLWFDETRRRTVNQIAAIARRHKRRHGLDLLILDYLQLIAPEETRGVPREQQVSAICRSLKVLAGELGVPIVCLAQVSRAVEAREDKQPRLSDLRESGSIEQDSDVVLFVDRPCTHTRDADPTEASIIVAKCRNGQRGKVPLRWTGNTLTFAAEQLQARGF